MGFKKRRYRHLYFFSGPGALGWGGRWDCEDNWIHSTWSFGSGDGNCPALSPFKKGGIAIHSFCGPLCAPTIPQCVRLGLGGRVSGIALTKETTGMSQAFCFVFAHSLFARRQTRWFLETLQTSQSRSDLRKWRQLIPCRRTC